MAGPATLTDDTFNATRTGEDLLVVDVWAPWCGPCRTFGPVIDRLATEYAGRVMVAKLNMDENPITAEQLGVRSIPSLLFFDRGALVDRTVGALPESIARAKVEQLIKRAASAPRAA